MRALGAEHHIHLMLSHASYSLLTCPMSRRLRRAPGSYVNGAGDTIKAAPVECETLSATSSIVTRREPP